MLTTDHHVQNALYRFNREMKGLNQGATVPSLTGLLPSFRKEQEMLKRITHKRPSKYTALNGSLTRRGVLFAKANLSSSLSTEEKVSWLSIGTWIPYHNL